MTDVSTRRPVGSDHSAWWDLYRQYLVFYETEFPPEQTDRLWQRLLDDGNPIECLVAEKGGEIIGIAHYLPRPTTWDDRQLCYLEDLFVDPANRGAGVGESLIGAVQARARERGWAYVYWETADDNHRARALYDKLTGGASGFITYELTGESST